MADGGRFASVTVRHFGGRHHEAWRQGDFSESIVRLRGFRSRRSVTGGASSKLSLSRRRATALPAWWAKSRPKSQSKSPPKSPPKSCDLSLLLVGRLSAEVQRCDAGS
jgi:hypothetical protein